MLLLFTALSCLDTALAQFNLIKYDLFYLEAH